MWILLLNSNSLINLLSMTSLIQTFNGYAVQISYFNLSGIILFYDFRTVISFGGEKDGVKCAVISAAMKVNFLKIIKSYHILIYWS